MESDGKFHYSGGLAVHLGRHGAGRMAILAAALAGAVVSAAAPSLPQSYLSYIYSPSAQVMTDMVGAFKTDAKTFIAAANAEAARQGAGGTCFGAQLDGKLQSAAIQKRVEESEVYLIGRDKDGVVVGGGTGSVIRGSGGKILTAGHVSAVGAKDGVTTFKAYSSTGKFLGELTEQVHGSKVSDTDLGRAWNGYLDTGVLTVNSPDLQSRAAFAAIEGIDLAPVQSTVELAGIFGSSTMVGTNHGHSGAALIDQGGLLHGVLSTGTPIFTNIGGTVVVHQASIEGMSNGGQATSDITTSRATDATFVPVSDPVILAALGDAGRVKVDADAPINDDQTSRMFVAGYSLMGCRASEGRMGGIMRPLDMADDARMADRQAATGHIGDINQSIAAAVGFGTAARFLQAPEPLRTTMANTAPPSHEAVDLGKGVRIEARRDGSLTSVDKDGNVLATMNIGMPVPDTSMSLTHAAAWKQGSQPGAMSAVTALGTYDARINPERVSLKYVADHDLAPALVADLPRSGAIEVDATRVRSIAGQHERVLEVAAALLPEAKASFSVSPLNDGGLLEVCKLDGKIGFPPEAGPAIRVIGRNGQIASIMFSYDGVKLGSDPERAMAIMNEEYPDAAARLGARRRVV